MSRRLGKPLMPWQQHVADVALEVDPVSGQLAYEEIVITVPRQSGKTTLLLALMVWRCVVMARRLDDAQTVTYLAQSGKMARRKLEREFLPILRAARGFAEVPHSRARPVRPTDFKPSMNNGSEHVLFGTGAYLQIEAPTEKASHGDVLDMPVVDEAFAREDDLVEQAVDAATVTRRSPQTFVISTSGNERSRYLWLKVLAGRQAVEQGRSGRSAYFEWSVPHDADYGDQDVWREYLPALGWTISEERLSVRLEKARRNPDVVDVDGYEPGLPGFRRAYLNQWMRTPLLGSEVVPVELGADVWMSSGLVDRGSRIVGRPVFGVAVGSENASAAIVAVGRRDDGLPHVETLVRESGSWWVEKALRDLVALHSPQAVGWPASGPTRVIQPDIERACGSGRDVASHPLSGREWSASCEALVVAVKEGRVRHMGDVLIADAAAGAVRREVGQGWEWDVRGSRSDITPLVAATAALRALEVRLVRPAFFVY